MSTAFQPNAFQNNAFQIEVSPPTGKKLSEFGISEIGGGNIPNQLQYPGISSGSGQTSGPVGQGGWVVWDKEGKKWKYEKIGLLNYLYEGQLEGETKRSIKLTSQFKGEINKKITNIETLTGKLEKTFEGKIFLFGSSSRKVGENLVLNGRINKILSENQTFVGKVENNKKLYYLIYDLLLDD